MTSPCIKHKIVHIFQIVFLALLPSSDICCNMSAEFETFWKPFVRSFQIFCLSPYSIFRRHLHHDSQKSRRFTVYFVIFTLVHVTSVFSTIYVPSSIDSGHDGMEQTGGTIMYFVNALSIFGSYVTHLIIPLENVFCGKHEDEICEKLKTIADIFATKLNFIPDYKSKRTKYLQQTVLLFVFVILFVFASAFTSLPELYHDKFFMQPTMIFGTVILRVRWCQIALFFRMIGDTLHDLQALLKQHQIQSFQWSHDRRRNEFVCQRIQYFRDIYSNIWHITTLISDCFGWSLISFLIKIELELIIGAYWFYINLQLHESMGLNLRERNFYK